MGRDGGRGDGKPELEREGQVVRKDWESAHEDVPSSAAISKMGRTERALGAGRESGQEGKWITRPEGGSVEYREESKPAREEGKY